MKMKLLAITIITLVVGGLIYLDMAQLEQLEQINVESKFKSTATAPQPLLAPDFDTRQLQRQLKRQSTPKQTVAAGGVAGVAEVESIDLAQTEQALQLLINGYNEVLHDPAAKRKLAQQFKQQSEDYKKALLAKVKRGEI